MGRYILTLASRREITVDPTNIESLDLAKREIEKAVKSYEAGHIFRTIANRQLADIATERSQVSA